MILDPIAFDTILDETLSRMDKLMDRLGHGDPPLDSIYAQLLALRELTAAPEPIDAELKHRFNFGLLATRALVQVDASLADRVCALSSYVHLRIHPPRPLLG